ALRRTWNDPQGRAGTVILAAIAAFVLLGPAIVADPLAQPDVLGGTLLPPGIEHPFGTDQLSRDILARVVVGGRVSLTVAVLAVAVSMTLGAGVGLVAGYLGGAADSMLMRLVDGALAVPRLFMLLLVLTAMERIPVGVLVLLIGGTGWFATSRLVRGETLRLRDEAFVRAAESLGAPRRRVILRHLLPNVLGPLLVAATLGVGDVILLEAGLSFLGLGIQPPAPSWGGMILDSRSVLTTAPWPGLFPGLAVMLTVLAANLVGDALRGALDLGGA
ncbi:MAG: ABC transporter permease, partial [Gemmatimonadales bacterium]|nr:ABC transporter permease [Gemmatimonadales bacterium]